MITTPQAEANIRVLNSSYVDGRIFNERVPSIIAQHDYVSPGTDYSKAWWLEVLMGQQFCITPNYRDSLQQGLAPRSQRYESTLSDYFAGAQLSSLGSRSMLSEVEAPREILDRLRYPHALNTRSGRFFAGRTGCVSDLHVDWFSHWLLVMNLFGEKRVTLVPPASTARLFPLGSFSALDFRSVTGEERQELLCFLNGLEVVMRPGDILVQPPLWWHHVEYISESATLSVGAGPHNDYISSFFSDSNLPRDWRLLAFYDALLSRPQLSDAQRRACEAVRKAWAKDSLMRDPERLDAMRHALKAIDVSQRDIPRLEPLYWCKLGLTGR